MATVFCRTHHTSDRQQLLQYGIVVHALIDTLDPTHVVTNKRPSYPNKLTKKTRNGLRYRVFRVYLQFVTDSRKFTGATRGPKKPRRSEVTLGPQCQGDWTSVGPPLYRRRI